MTPERLQEIKEWVPKNRSFINQWLEKALTECTTEIAALEERLDDLCWHCANPDIETPGRHIHEIGDKQVAHWHHCIDPGDGLPSPCKNSDRLEEVFKEFASRFCEDHSEEVRDGCQMCAVDAKDAELERLRMALDRSIYYFDWIMRRYLGVGVSDEYVTCEKKLEFMYLDAKEGKKEAEDALTQK